jgi:hypothetical protein
MGFDGGKIGGIEFKFKLEFSWLSFAFTVATHRRNSDSPRQFEPEGAETIMAEEAQSCAKTVIELSQKDNLRTYAKWQSFDAGRV